MELLLVAGVYMFVGWVVAGASGLALTGILLSSSGEGSRDNSSEEEASPDERIRHIGAAAKEEMDRASDQFLRQMHDLLDVNEGR